MDAVYFDLDGTLVEFDRSFVAIVEDAAVRLDAELPEGSVETFGRALGEHLESAENPYATAAAVADLPVDPEAFATAMQDVELAATVPVAGARDAVAALADDYRLGVLTNGHGPMQRAKVDAGGFGDVFEAVVVSGDVGVGKPDPEIFAAAERQLPADDHVFVADALDRDVRAAEAAGWRGVYYGSEVPADVTRVGSLSVLPELL
ncbi:HAD family hydrolase [Halobacterium wangiae]|uniref:HAD family hydrolase n=1 Tax=Halobacterium wangiae TaxID=2902623 RepID=UPI001E55AE0C|nr:HAD family hydrolase [Halobacterium wangiae]